MCRIVFLDTTALDLDTVEFTSNHQSLVAQHQTYGFLGFGFRLSFLFNLCSSIYGSFIHDRTKMIPAKPYSLGAVTHIN